MSEMHETMKRVFEVTGMQPTELAVALNTSPQNVTNWNARGISKQGAALVSKKLGVSATYIFTGEGEKMSSMTKEQASPTRESNVSGVVDMQLWSSSEPLPEDEYDFIPYLKDVEFRAGDGAFAVEDYNGFKLAFAKSTLRRYGIPTDKAVMVSVSGDSMEPVLPPGATVGINMGDRNIVDGKMYAITHGDLLRVKRLYRLPNGYVRINSYNDIDYKDEVVPIDEIEVVGKVFTWQVMV